MDWLHYTSIIICIAQMIYILLYYCPLAYYHMNDEEFEGNKFVSDFLFSDNIYRSVMTFFVAIQLGVCVLYVCRLRDAKKEDSRFFFAEIFLFAGSWVGWSMLCAQYSSPGGGSGEIHFAGVGIFIFCSAFYVGVMLYHVNSIKGEWSTVARVEFYMSLVFFLVSVALGVDFIVGALARKKLAWVTEHISFIFFIASHMTLFILDSNRSSRAETNDGEAVANVVKDEHAILVPVGARNGASFTEPLRPLETALFHGIRLEIHSKPATLSSLLLSCQ